MTRTAINRIQRHHVAVGDTRTPIGATLKQSGAAATLLDSSTVEFKMIDSSGTVVVDWTAATIVSQPAAEVQYDFQAADVDTAGTFYAYFRIVDGGEYDTFPPDGRWYEVVIYDPYAA